jgi:hypothetical protein
VAKIPFRSSGVLFPLFVAFLAVASACAGSRADDEDLRQAFEALSRPLTAPAQLGPELVTLLDAEGRQVLEARAAALSRALGVAIKPAEAFQVRGLPDGVRVSTFEVLEQEGDRGRGRVTLAFADRGPDDRRVMLDPIDFDVRREDGMWRIHLAALEGQGGAQW